MFTMAKLKFRQDSLFLSHFVRKIIKKTNRTAKI